MFRSNYSNPQPGYAKLNQEDSFEEEDYFSLDNNWSNYNSESVDFIITRPRKQKRALSESRKPYTKVVIPKSSMEIVPIDNEQAIKRGGDDQRSNTWFSKKFKFKSNKGGVRDKDLELYRTVFALGQDSKDFQDLQDWQVSPRWKIKIK